MKKFAFPVIGILVAILILFLSIVRYSRQQYETSYVGNDSLASSESALLKKYYLPYPGMLPDHSLYFTKMLRDRGRLILTRDREERVNLLLFYADKRIGAAEALLRGNKFSLAEVTAFKAEQYVGQAMEILREYSEEEKNESKDLWWKYYRSVTAHKELLEEMEMMVEGDARVSLGKVLDNCEVYRDEIMGELGIEDGQKENVDEDQDVEESEDVEVLDKENGYL